MAIASGCLSPHSRTIRLRPCSRADRSTAASTARATPRPRAAGRGVHPLQLRRLPVVAVAAPAAAADRLAAEVGHQERPVRRLELGRVHRGVVAAAAVPRRRGRPGPPGSTPAPPGASKRCRPDLDLTHAVQGTTAAGRPGRPARSVADHSARRKWSQPAGPSYAPRRPSRRPLGHPPDRPPPRRQRHRRAGRSRPGRGRRHRPRIQVYGSTPSACAASAHLPGHLEGVPAQVDRPPRWPSPRAPGRPAARPTRRSWRWRRAGRPPARPGTAPRGRRYASTSSRGVRKPRDSTVQPAAAQPVRPARATTSPGRAPGADHRRPAAQVAEGGDRDGQGGAGRHVPADHARADQWPPPRPSPSASSSAQAVSRSAGMQRATSRAVGVAPIAAMSARLAAAARCPTSRAVDQSRRKCRPSTSTSVRGHHPPVRRGHHRRVVTRAEQAVVGPYVSRAVTRSIRPNSPTPATSSPSLVASLVPHRSLHRVSGACLAHRCSPDHR